MAHHHLLPFLALILVILPSCSHADDQTPALFSESNNFLFGGNNLTDGIYTLSLENNCSLLYYVKGVLTKDYNTTIKDAKGCQLSINRRGQLLVGDGDGKNPRHLGHPISKDNKEFALLFTNKGLCVYGPRIWDNKISRDDELQFLKNKNLRATITSNVLYSSQDKNSTEVNGPIATAEDVSLYITRYCALSVKNTKTGENKWDSNSTSAEPRDCSLYLTERGVLSLISKDSKGVLHHTQWTGGDLQKVNDYALVFRPYGGLDIYGFAINVRDIPPHAGSVAENIKMVTA